MLPVDSSNENQPPAHGFRQHNLSYPFWFIVIPWTSWGRARGQSCRVEERRGGEENESARWRDVTWLWLCTQKWWAMSQVMWQPLGSWNRSWLSPWGNEGCLQCYTCFRLNLSNNLNRIGINDALEPKDKTATLQTPWEIIWKEISEAKTWPAECLLTSSFSSQEEPFDPC